MSFRYPAIRKAIENLLLIHHGESSEIGQHQAWLILTYNKPELDRAENYLASLSPEDLLLVCGGGNGNVWSQFEYERSDGSIFKVDRWAYGFLEEVWDRIFE